MGFAEDASNFFDKGISAAKGAVCNVACEQLNFVRAVCDLCDEGFKLGYHECNGGNVSYRLAPEDVSGASSYFYTTPSSWMALPFSVPEMANQYLLVSAAGAFLKNVKEAPAVHLGIVQIDQAGGAWRTMWGFRNNGMPTSELGAHVGAQGARLRATNGASRVVYHAHPTALIALSALLAPESKLFTNALWKSFTESIIAFPEGVGALGWVAPGSQSLAQATSEALATFPACVWQLHGVVATGPTCDRALGLVHTIDKAASIYLTARASAGGKNDLVNELTNDNLLAIAKAYNLPFNSDLLA